MNIAAVDLGCLNPEVSDINSELLDIEIDVGRKIKYFSLPIVILKTNCIFVVIKLLTNGHCPVNDNNTRCATHKNCQRVNFFKYGYK